MKNIKVGLYGIGLDTYWDQFEGLHDRLIGYQNYIADNMQKLRSNVEVINTGIVDNPKKAYEVGDQLAKENVDIVFLFISTYALSSTVLPVVQQLNVPVVLLNLQPTKAIDYEWFNNLGDRGLMTGEWLANCQACSLPEIASVFIRANIDINMITGTLHDEEAWQEIHDWIDAAVVSKGMRNNRMGILGHYYNGMLDIYTDPTMQSLTFGTHIEHVEMDEVLKYRNEVTQDELKNKITEIYNSFDVQDDCSDYEIERTAKTAVSLDKLVETHDLGSIAYYYEGVEGSDLQNIITSVITGTSILTSKHIPVAGEMEIKNVQAMKILDLFNAGGSFTEFYGVDFNDDIVLMGHDGPGHIKIAEDKPILKKLGVYHGKPGNGLSVEMKVKQGPVTILSVVQTADGKMKLLVAEGQSVEGPIFEIGNTNSRYKFDITAKEFINKWSMEGPAHHCAIGIGHISSKIEKFAKIKGIEIVQIC